MGIGRATREVLREPWWWVWMAVAVAWVGLSSWSFGANEIGRVDVTSATLVVMLLGTGIHRQVRQKRGFDGEHWAVPPIVGAATLAILLVVDAVEPVMSLPEMLFYAGGLTVIFGVFSYGETYYNARQRRARPDRGGTEQPRPA